MHFQAVYSFWTIVMFSKLLFADCYLVAAHNVVSLLREMKYL